MNLTLTCMLNSLISKSQFKHAHPNRCSEISTIVCLLCMFPTEWRIKRTGKQQRLLIIDEPIWDSVQTGRGGLCPNISAQENTVCPRCQTFKTGVFSHISAPEQQAQSIISGGKPGRSFSDGQGGQQRSQRCLLVWFWEFDWMLRR